MNNILNYIPKSIAKLHSNIMPIKGIGSYIIDNNNIKYLDFTSGIGALSTGHSHPTIIKGVKNQLDKIVHAPQQVFLSHEPQIDLTKKLLDIMPFSYLNNIFYVPSGSEATDNAIKIARKYTEKTNIIAINKGFHGRTLGALSVTSSNINCKYKTAPVLSGVYFSEPTIESIHNILSYNTDPAETAAIIFESIQGEGGVHSLPNDFLAYINDICKQNNILMIADEVQCGAGRTGTWWNVEQKNIVPDIMTFGKGIASGFPLAGIACNNNITDNLGQGYLGGTYGGNALVSMAASKTIDVIKNENLLENTNIMGTYLKKELEKFEQIKEVRQYGLMIAIELFNNDNAKTIVSNLQKNNVLVLLAGHKNQYIRLLPPLNINYNDIEVFLDAFNKSV